MKAIASISLAILVIGTCAYLVLFTSPYLSVSELVENPWPHIGMYVRVIGNVSRTVFVNETEGSVVFLLTDGISSINVKYRKSLPTTWKEGLPIVAAGVLVREDMIEADQIITQCPSRYVP